MSEILKKVVLNGLKFDIDAVLMRMENRKVKFMGICWYCHWGWPVKVAEIYKNASAMCDDMWMPLHFGPSHIVWEDENFDDHSIQYCIHEINTETYDKFTDEQLRTVMWSLNELASIPEDERCVEPDDYDGEHPEDYPPTCEMSFPATEGDNWNRKAE